MSETFEMNFDDLETGSEKKGLEKFDFSEFEEKTETDVMEITPKEKSEVPEGQGIKMVVDLVWMTDTTGSMSPYLENAIRMAMTMHEDVSAALSQKGREVQMRQKFIAYRDLFVDSEYVVESDYFDMASEKEDSDKFLKGLKAQGGGDEPESALDAFSYALRYSDPLNYPEAKDAPKSRVIYILVTDATAHPLEKNLQHEFNGKKIAASLEELQEDWCNPQLVPQREKRLIIFGPACSAYSEIVEEFDNVVHIPCKAGSGMSDLDKGLIINSLRNSIA